MTEARWSPHKAGRFLFKQWDDDAAVYDIIAGDTHVVEALVMELLEIVKNRGLCTSSELLDEIFRLMPDESPDVITGAVYGALQRMQQIGLVVGDGH